MDTLERQTLLQKYAPAMAYIAVKDDAGNCGIGSAFHVGEGVFVTARHVVENYFIEEVVLSEHLRVPIQEVVPEYPQEAIDELAELIGSPPTWPLLHESLSLTDGPYFHNDEKADIAVFRVGKIHPNRPFVPLGSHLDDWIIRNEWRLSEALILGYPPIPFTTAPELISARAEINTVTWTRAQSHATFILSAIPRGGFSGGLAIHEFDFALGVITQSLIQGGQPAELGFLSVLSVEPIYECLAQNKLLPDCQKERWEDFWNTERADFVAEGGLLVASVHFHDDGKKFYFDVMAREPQFLKIGVDAGLVSMKGAAYEEEKLRDDWIRFHIKLPGKQASILVETAAKAAQEAIAQTGLKSIQAFQNKN
ncbi:trypsin-like peptidase domain-containing protein [Sneathiella litorea]|uniref:Trypsin-like peptidase domain-containing protein n=1 Tax=Sneathiella litorea TaxID=2606216 RepID=A0A6L8W6T5_9PROT|nr:trypsin-like peptidase domain-containing protein [Sneathiella litorea]MZR30233.1 hypothetical protein [Sneathiella litorea]